MKSVLTLKSKLSDGKVTLSVAGETLQDSARSMVTFRTGILETNFTAWTLQAFGKAFTPFPDGLLDTGKKDGGL